MNNASNWNGGVLIIGSLLWQPNLGPDDSLRENWRQTRLNLESMIKVKTPIRYGRESGGGIITMTFANTCRRSPGTGVVIPFNSNPITDNAIILDEARQLSSAEGMNGRFFGLTNEGEVWSALGILLNRKIKDQRRKSILTWWEAQFRGDNRFTRFDSGEFRHRREQPSIRQNGILNIPWPHPADNQQLKKLNNFDFLLATSTLPTGNRYPTIAEISINVTADQIRQYFRNNREHGIETFQDERIMRRIL